MKLINLLLLVMLCQTTFSQAYENITAIGMLPVTPEPIPQENANYDRMDSEQREIVDAERAEIRDLNDKLESYAMAIDGAFTEIGYSVVDRTILAKSLEEIMNQQEGGVAGDSVGAKAQVGKTMGISHFSVIKLSMVKSKKREGLIGGTLKGTFGSVDERKIELTVKVISVESGIVVWSQSTTAKFNADPDKVAKELLEAVEAKKVKKDKNKKK